MQLCVRTQRITCVLHEPWFASEAGSAPTMELQLDSKFYAPITPAKTPGAPCSLGCVEDSTETPLATNTCGMQDMTCVCVVFTVLLPGAR